MENLKAKSSQVSDNGFRNSCEQFWTAGVSKWRHYVLINIEVQKKCICSCELFLPKTGMREKQVLQDPGYVRGVEGPCCMLHAASYLANII